MTFSSSFLFKEDSKNVLAKTNNLIYNSIVNNINTNFGWFTNTHGNSNIGQYFIPINGKNIPYAQQNGCNGYVASNIQITNSCNNYLGSHSDIDNFRTFKPTSDYNEKSIHFIGIR